MTISIPNYIGKKGEQKALDYLIKKEMRLICSNYRSKYGEIDIIVCDDKYIVFVEVKTRRSDTLISGIESVNRKKQERIIKTACVYIQDSNVLLQPRFDVIEVKRLNEQKFEVIRHIENAFSAEGNYAFF